MADQLDVLKPGEKAGPARKVLSLIPGVVLCAVVTFVAIALQTFEEATLRHPYIEAIVMAILLGNGAAYTVGAQSPVSGGNSVQREADA